MSQHHFTWFHDILNNFSGRRSHDVTKTSGHRPAPKDSSGGLPANEGMLRGLYHGNYPGLEFASALTLTPILTTVSMMGIPTPVSEDERTQEVLNEVVALMSDKFHQLHRSGLLLGTAWRFPRFDATTQQPVWEPIPDVSISDILLDIVSGSPRAILTHEQIKLQTGENITEFVERKRRFELGRVEVKWIGSHSADVRDITARNVSGELPIPFSYDADESDIRGYSIFARIIRELKDYHDIDFMRSETLAKFRVKQVQTVKNITAWLGQNGLDPESFASLDVADQDFILNLFGDESTKFEFLPESATKPYSEALKGKYMKIVEGVGIPEIFWGISLSGNHADGDNQVQKGVDFVKSIRDQWTRPYQRLFSATLRLLSIARMETYQPFKITWNRLDSLSATAKAEIFAKFAVSVSTLAGCAMVTKQQVYDLWVANYPDIPVGEFEEWVAGIQDMASFRQFLGLDYASGLEDFGTSEGGKK